MNGPVTAGAAVSSCCRRASCLVRELACMRTTIGSVATLRRRGASVMVRAASYGRMGRRQCAGRDNDGV